MWLCFDLSQDHRMETDYLKRCFGNCLTQALAEVGKVRPSDPIEYLAHWLYHYRKITKAKEKVCMCFVSSWGGLSQSNLKSKAGFWSWPRKFLLGLFSLWGWLSPRYPISAGSLGGWRRNTTHGSDGVGGFRAPSRLKLVTGADSGGLKGLRLISVKREGPLNMLPRVWSDSTLSHLLRILKRRSSWRKNMMITSKKPKWHKYWSEKSMRFSRSMRSVTR